MSNTPTTWSISQIVNHVTVRRCLNLDPDYQRDVVWSIAQQAYFVVSVLIEDMPTHNLIFRDFADVDDHDGARYNCIDGKQRCTSICNFVNNMLHIVYEGEERYFQELPMDTQCRIKAKILPVWVVECDDETERRIFQNINNGTPLSSGEKATSHRQSPINKLREQYLDSGCEYYKALESLIGKSHMRKKRKDWNMKMNAIVGGLGMGPNYITTSYDPHTYGVTQEQWDHQYHNTFLTNKNRLLEVLQDVVNGIGVPVPKKVIPNMLWAPGKLMGVIIYAIFRYGESDLDRIKEVLIAILKDIVADTTVYDEWRRHVYGTKWNAINPEKLQAGWDIMCIYKEHGRFTR